jgi:hypothetical protein
MKLFALGCSLTYGHGLPDCVGEDIKNPGPVASDHAWPRMLSDMLGVDCVNLALPGISNKYILKRILETAIQRQDMVVVQWTYFSRWTVFKDDQDHQHIGPWKNDSFKNFLENYYTDADCVFNNVQMIDHAWLHLKSIGCPFVFACAEKGNEKFWNEEDKIKHLFNQSDFIHARFDSSIKYFMVDKALDDRHPGEHSHRSYAKYLRDLPTFAELTNTK